MPTSFKNQTIKNNKEKTMKKTLLALLSIAIAFTAMQPSQAEDQKVLAIIDTAIDSSKFTSIIQEVCITSTKSVASKMACPNGQSFMEGAKAASAPWPTNLNSPTYHGDSMVKAALVVNPNIKIVFVRYADITTSGNPVTNVDALVKAINWVSQNAEKYSVDAVSISQAFTHKDNLAKCSSDAGTINAVSSLNLKNIPTFVSTGNDGRSDVVGFPSCVTGVIGVGALGSETALEKATNKGPGLDLLAVSRVAVTKYNGSATSVSGTSSATVLAASSYVKNVKTTAVDYLNSLSKITVSGASYLYSNR